MKNNLANPTKIHLKKWRMTLSKRTQRLRIQIWVSPWLSLQMPFKCGICDKIFMTGPILEKNHMLAIMVRKFQERNPLKGKALDFENLISKVYKCVYCPKGFWNDIARENSDRSQWSKWSFRNKILIFALMRNSYYSVTFHHHGTLNTLY